MNSDERQLALEEQIAYLQRHVEQLESVILQQGRSVDALQVESKRQREVVAKLLARDQTRSGPDGTADPILERPPHY